MEEITVKRYKANDGKVFDNEKECVYHETQIHEQEEEFEKMVIYAKKLTDFCNSRDNCTDCPLCKYNDGYCPC